MHIRKEERQKEASVLMDEGNHISTSYNSSPKNFSRTAATTTASTNSTQVNNGGLQDHHSTKLKKEMDMVMVVAKPKVVKEQRKTRMHARTHLHTQERAVRRAGFDDLVASKMYSLDLLRKLEEKIQKVIEEEEIKTMRKKMIPRAQLMPVFDRPFLPRRSMRPLTVPEEPRVLSRSCLNDNVDPYRLFQKSLLR